MICTKRCVADAHGEELVDGRYWPGRVGVVEVLGWARIPHAAGFVFWLRAMWVTAMHAGCGLPHAGRCQVDTMLQKLVLRVTRLLGSSRIRWVVGRAWYPEWLVSVFRVLCVYVPHGAQPVFVVLLAL